MVDIEPDFNKIGGIAVAELIKSSLRSFARAALLTIKRIAHYTTWPFRRLWRMSGLELHRRQNSGAASTRSDSKVISDNVLWKISKILTYPTAPGKTTFLVDGPLCPTHMSPLWFGLQTDVDVVQREPITDKHYIDNRPNPHEMGRIMYCPDDDEIFSVETSQNVSEMRLLAESKLRGQVTRALAD